MRHKRPPKPEASTFWGPATDTEAGVGSVERERLSDGPDTPQGRHLRPDRVQNDSRSIPIALDDASNAWAASIEDGEDGRLHRVGGSRRVRGDAVALVVGAIFLAGALLKPWATPAPHAADQPSEGPTTGIAAATNPGAPAPTEPPTDAAAGGQAPGGRPTLPPWLERAGRGQFLVVDWGPLLAGDAHSGWGIATAVLPDSLPQGPDVTSLTPLVSWTARGPNPATALAVRAPAGRMLAVAVTWPGSVHPTSVTFEYLGADPWLRAAEGSRSFTATRVVDALVSAARAQLGATVDSGTYWLPPSPDGFGGLLMPSSAALTAGWPSGDYVVRVHAGKDVVAFPMRIVGA